MSPENTTKTDVEQRTEQNNSYIYPEEIASARRLLDTIRECPSPFHSALESKSQLRDAGFQELCWNENWNLEKCKGYFVCPFDTTVIAFRVNADFKTADAVRILTSHIDSPCLRIKSTPELIQKNYLKLNTEIYGGAIYSTWLDRPLSAAGKVCLKNINANRIDGIGINALRPDIRFVDFKKPMFVIPNLSIHMNRKVNDGISLNAQIDMLPIAGTGSASHVSETFLTDCIAEKLNVPKEDILSYEFTIYNMEQGYIAGIQDDLILAPRIDNISSLQACLTGIIDGQRTDGIDIIGLFDHEEVGSRSKNGADSNLFSFTVERIYAALNITREEYLKNITNGLMISLDVAHAVNPNHTEKNDITTEISLNEGIAVKSSSRQNYCGDSEMTAILLQLAEKNNIPCKINFLRSDMPGGSTLGPILSASLPMLSADMGIPVLAMHSAMETAGVKDQYHLEKFAREFFS